MIDRLTRSPNVYADTSGVRRFDYFVQAIQRSGPGKILFGSDGPWLHPGLELHKIKLLGLSPRNEALILGDNLAWLMRPPTVREPRGPSEARIAGPAPSRGSPR